MSLNEITATERQSYGMEVRPDFVHPRHCFCQIPVDELRPWAVRKYVEGESTVELIASTDDPHEKEIISIVATLDLDEGTMLEVMGDVDRPTHHIIHCREDVKQLLKLFE